jgi:hypothetical protein
VRLEFDVTEASDRVNNGELLVLLWEKMPVSIVENTSDYVVLAVKVPLSATMLESEENIQTALNEAGTIASGVALEQYDTSGEPLEVEGRTWTSKGALAKTYQTPYGAVEVKRHVYQSSEGGATYCPLEVDSRVIVTSTPRFAKQIAHKYAEMSLVTVLGKD